MTATSHKSLFWAGGALLLLSVFAAAYHSLPLLCFVPLLAVAALFFVQYPVLLFYALLFFIPWSGEFNFTESLGTDLPDEPLMLLMAFTVIILLFYRKKKSSPRLPVLLFLLLTGFAWSIVTAITSTDILVSGKYELAKAWYLLAFVGAPLLLKNEEKLVQRSALVLFISMFLVTCLVMVKHAQLGFTFASINEALSPFFRNHVNYSALLVFMVPLQLAFIRLGNRKWHFLLLVSLLLVLAALVLSYARGAWLALVIGLLAYWLIRKGWLLKAFLAVLLIIASAVFWLQHNDNYLRFAPRRDTTIFHKDFGEHLAATYKGKDVSTAERFYRWVAGARMSKENWLTGFGPTTFTKHYQSYAIPAFRTWVSDNREQSTVHNYFLLLQIEQGVAGLFFFLLLLGTMFHQAQVIYHRTNDPFWKTTAVTIAAILLMQCTVNFLSDLIETDKVGSVFYLCVAFLLIADAKTKRTAKEATPEQTKE